MKFNVSVPDKLWSEVLAQSTVGDSPSAVVQDALRRATIRISEPPELDEEATSMFEEARKRVRESAQATYSKGYKAGLRLAGDLSWDALRAICEIGVVAALDAEKQRVAAAFADGRYPVDVQHPSPFVADLRRDDYVADLECGEDEDGEWYKVSDTFWHNYWVREIHVSETGITTGGDPHNQLLVLGTDAALRDVLAAATPH